MSALATIRAKAIEALRHYHNLLPGFLEMYAGGPKRLGPVFVKDAELLYAISRLMMPSKILEIGVGLAGSTIAFAEALAKNRRGHLYAVDISQAAIDRSRRLLGYHGLALRATFIRGDSRDRTTTAKVAQAVGQAEILFIDGDHSFEGCRADFENYHELVVSAGLILVHDTGVFPAQEKEMLARLLRATPDELLIPDTSETGVYHRPGVPAAIDWIVANHPEYGRVSLHTMAEPCCGMAILQKRAALYSPSASFIKMPKSPRD